MKTIRISDKHSLGEGHRCFVLAEVGLNHNGDRKLAAESIAAAAESGADGVKFQNYRTEDFISDRSQTYSYISQGKEVTESMFEMFKRNELDRDFVAYLKSVCDECGIEFCSTPTGQDGIDDLVAVGTPVIKNGSDYLTNHDLIRRMGETGLPAIVSCGMASLADIERAVTAFFDTGNKKLVLLHCTSSYPTTAEDVHLRKMLTLQQMFDVPCGFSDHTDGIIAGCLSASMGACMIEKHFTLDKKLPGPDHRFSCDPAELAALVDGLLDSEKMLGDARIGLAQSEIANRDEFRLSCVASRNLPAGHVLCESDVSFKRPGTGIPPEALQYFVGRRLAVGVATDHQLDNSQFS